MNLHGKVQLRGTRERHYGTVLATQGGFAIVSWDDGITAWVDRFLLEQAWAS